MKKWIWANLTLKLMVTIILETEDKIFSLIMNNSQSDVNTTTDVLYHYCINESYHSKLKAAESLVL